VELILSLAQLFIVNWWKNVFTCKYIFPSINGKMYLHVNTFFHQLTINSFARLNISSTLI